MATNAGGIRGAKYGVTQDYVLGLEVVLADGSVMRTGSKCMKSVSGYELTKIFVGSEGTLGVVTEITLKINPLPRNTVTATIAFAQPADAGRRTVSRIVKAGIVPCVMELTGFGVRWKSCTVSPNWVYLLWKPCCSWRPTVRPRRKRQKRWSEPWNWPWPAGEAI